jgi:hypothetical protein
VIWLVVLEIVCQLNCESHPLSQQTIGKPLLSKMICSHGQINDVSYSETYVFVSKPKSKLAALADDMKQVLFYKKVIRKELESAPRHSGMLSCFFQGFFRSLFCSNFKARAMRSRVACGMITSSI